MKRSNARGFFAVMVLVVLFPVAAVAGGTNEFPDPPAIGAGEPSTSSGTATATEGTQTAVLAGGCFWGMEGVFEMLIGVTEVRSGYSGGDDASASYYTVARGLTDHAEAIEVVYDPSIISYGTLLEIFFSVAHDPTQLNYQGPDHGTQYRSAIFYANEAEKTLAEAYMAKLDQEKVFEAPIVTELSPLKEFYPAEDYHQDFIVNNPTYPYVVYWDLPKMEHLRQDYPELVEE